MNKFLFLILSVCFYSLAFSQKDSLTIENATISRKFYFFTDSAGFYSEALVNKRTNENYINPATEEFSISINNQTIDGRNCRYLSHSFRTNGQIKSLIVKLKTPVLNIYVQLEYELYENIPVIRKQFQLINESKNEIALFNLDVEKLRFQVVNKLDNEVYTGYGTNISRIPYKGDYNDAAVLLFNSAAKQGVVFGNEAPGVLKSTNIYTQIHGCVQIGMRHIDEDFPFKKWLAAGETFVSPRTFIYAFNSPHWQDGYEYEYKTFVEKYLGISQFQRTKAPVFIYDTWKPFLDTINEKTVINCIDGLKNTGADLFVIDVGWYDLTGNYNVNKNKFPNGLKFLCDYSRKSGMRPGLWFSVASINANSDIAKQHPEWMIKDKNDSIANLHSMGTSTAGSGWADALRTMSLGSPYYDYFKQIVRSYIKELNLAYIKFDLSIVLSAYVHEPARSGDYETNGTKLYKDRSSSYWTIYERMMKMMDELHAEFPKLLIDCTYETWGRHNISDYALLQHADYEWLTNFEQTSPYGAISIRQMNFDRSRVLPTAALLMGNQSLDFDNYRYVFFSLASSSIVYVGDPQKMQTQQKSFYRKWSSYLKAIEEKYQYSHYLQLYNVFERPDDGNWDGCFRINPEKDGGLMFFFRNNSPDETRTFRIPCLDSKKTYRIYSFDNNKTIGVYKGKNLVEKGITVRIPSTYTAKVLTIEKIHQ